MDSHPTKSEIVDLVICEAKSWTRHSATIASLRMSPEEAKVFKPADFLDRRKNYMTLFNFCPDCGNEINWKQIKKSVSAKPVTEG